MGVRFDKLAEPTPEEIAAARAYTASSPRLHYLMQGRDALNCSVFAAELGLLEPLLPLIASVTRKFKLAEAARLYAGYANGYSVVGSLWRSDPQRFVGMTYSYHGFFSTSVDRAAALRFLEAGPVHPYSVFLSIDASQGLLGLPANELGPDNVDEAEVLVAPQTPFCIKRASRKTAEGGTSYLDLELAWPAD
jgi:hypothetical protein